MPGRGPELTENPEILKNALKCPKKPKFCPEILNPDEI